MDPESLIVPDKCMIKVEGFAHITPMTEEQTERFFEDYESMSRDELYSKW